MKMVPVVVQLYQLKMVLLKSQVNFCTMFVKRMMAWPPGLSEDALHQVRRKDCTDASCDQRTGHWWPGLVALGGFSRDPPLVDDVPSGYLTVRHGKIHHF